MKPNIEKILEHDCNGHPIRDWIDIGKFDSTTQKEDVIAAIVQAYEVQRAQDTPLPSSFKFRCEDCPRFCLFTTREVICKFEKKHIHVHEIGAKR